MTPVPTLPGVHLDVSAHDVVYAGAQKNLGPSGVTVVILSPWALKKGREGLPSMLDYKVHESKGKPVQYPEHIRDFRPEGGTGVGSRGRGAFKQP